MATSINYNKGKEVKYVYNATGDLVQMTDWLGETSFEVDLLHQPLTEHEVNGLDYRYVYSDKARLSVVVQGIEHGSAAVLDDKGELHAYYHCDYLGTTDYLTSAVDSRVISWTSYNEWGEISHNAVLKCGQRELDLVKLYATHDYDAVLNQYYAKARFYDADTRRFTAMDPILDASEYDLRNYTSDPMQLVQYLYVKDNAVNYIDPLGEMPVSWLSAIKDAYLSGLIQKDQVGSVVLIANIVSTSTNALDKVLKAALPHISDIRDAFREVENELRHDNASRQAIYLSFHETAQVLASKQIYIQYRDKIGRSKYPKVEVRNANGKEMDIKYSDWVWEVKPVGTSNSSFKRSLDKYVGKNLPTKLGGSFKDVSAVMFTAGNRTAYIYTRWIGPGRIEYYFKIQCRDEDLEDVSVKDLASDLIPIFSKAQAIDKTVEVGTLLAELFVAFADVVPGDEAVIIGKLIEAVF